MFLIDCPYCGTRPQSEFTARGEAHIARPADPSAASDAEWTDYLFARSNPKGLHFERWVHSHGCRRWFNIARDTATDAILACYPATAPRPDPASLRSASAHPPARPEPSPLPTAPAADPAAHHPPEAEGWQ